MSDIEDERTLRTRALVGRWFWMLVVALVVLGLLGGYVTATTHVSPGTHTEEQVESSWSTQATFDHQATVVESNPVFQVGSTLENRAVYYQSVSPEAVGTYTLSYDSAGDGDLSVETTLILQIRSVGEDGERGGESEETIYWENTDVLASSTDSNLAPGETVETEVQLNTTQLGQRIDEIESALGGGPGTVQASIVARSSIEGTVAGSQVQEVETYRIPFSISGETYSFGADDPWNQEFEETQQVQVANEYGPVRTVGGPLLLAIGLLGLIVLGFVRSRGYHELDTNEKAVLSYYRNRTAYDEWITRATLPPDSIDENPARVSTLEDLVDLAIDTDERVIEDPRRDAYIVSHEGTYYVYSPPVPIDEE